MDSELREDLVSGDWMIIVPGRAKSHVDIRKEPRVVAPLDSCPFEDFEKEDRKALLVKKNKDNTDWALQIIPNKYPVLVDKHEVSFKRMAYGPYTTLPGTGKHELLITRDHTADLPDFTREEALQSLMALQERYRAYEKEKHFAYVALFKNYGPKAGATVYHPHWQLIALPIIPPDVYHSLHGAHKYFDAHKECVHCVMLAFEHKEKKRVIFENDCAIAFTPYISRNPFEVRIMPKKHSAYFEDEEEGVTACVAEALQRSLQMFKTSLNDPDYNFFIHTAPIHEKKERSYYHWHIELLPKIKIDAGFELGTGIEVNFVDPDEAAAILTGLKPLGEY